MEESHFDMSGLQKDMGRLEAVAEQMLKVGDKMDDVLQRVTALETKAFETESQINRNMFWWGIAITSLVTLIVFLAGAAITIKLSK